MDEQRSKSVQNRFTAYLQAAIINKRIKYIEKKIQIREKEQLQVDLLEKNYINFEVQFREYKRDQDVAVTEDWEQTANLLKLVESNELLTELAKLKERELQILFGRVYGELSFAELGSRFNMSTKQAEMLYHYIIRKLRKKMEAYLNEF